MATIHFYNHLCQKAMELIKTKSSIDKAKAYNDIALIDNIIAEYAKGWGYNQDAAAELDERLRREHRETINKIDSVPSPSAFMSRGQVPVVNDPLIDRLKVDRFGILYDILQKEGLVHVLEEFIEHVE